MIVVHVVKANTLHFNDCLIHNRLNLYSVHKSGYTKLQICCNFQNIIHRKWFIWLCYIVLFITGKIDRDTKTKMEEREEKKTLGVNQLAPKGSDQEQHGDNINQTNTYMLTVSNQPLALIENCEAESEGASGLTNPEKEDIGLGIPKRDAPFDESQPENIHWSNSDSNSESEENDADARENDIFSGIQKKEGVTGVLQPRAADLPLQTRGQGATGFKKLQPRGQNVEGAAHSVDHQKINLPSYTRDQKVEGATGVSSEIQNFTLQADLKIWEQLPSESEMHNTNSSCSEIHKESNESKADVGEVEYKSKFYEEFEILDVLGKGGYGIVLKVQKKFDKNTYAVKRIKLRSEEKKKAQREVFELTNCDHPWIVRPCDSWLEDPPTGWQKEQDIKHLKEFLKSKDFSLSESYEDTESDPTGNRNTNANQVPSSYRFRDGRLDNQLAEGQTVDSLTSHGHQYLYIQMQFCDEGTLRNFIDSGKFKQTKAINLFGQLMCAIEYVHKRKLIHRDIMPRNVFILNGRVKLGDFGLVKRKKDEDKDISYLHTSKQGAKMYRAPELETKKYNEKVDIYSAGIILFELYYPMDTGAERQSVLTNLKKGQFPGDFPHHVKELITKMIHADPNARPAAQDVLQQSLFEEFRKNFFKNRHSLGTGTSDANQEDNSSSDPDSS